MADVVIETYEICLGTGPSDLALIVYVPGLVSLEKAKQLLKTLIEFRRVGAFVSATFADGAEFFIRTSPGALTATVSDATPEVILKELGGSNEPSIQLFVKQSKGEFVRIGSAPASVLATLST